MQLWERRDDETKKAYSAFKIYLEMENRSVKNVAEMLCVSEQNVRRWSRKYDWKSRAVAYDSSIVEETRRAKIATLKDNIIRKIDVASKLDEKALNALEKLNFNRISGHTIIEMLTLANQLLNEAKELKKQDENAEMPMIIIKRYGEDDQES